MALSASFRCNRCWEVIESPTAWLTSCWHLFCSHRHQHTAHTPFPSLDCLCLRSAHSSLDSLAASSLSPALLLSSAVAGDKDAAWFNQSNQCLCCDRELTGQSAPHNIYTATELPPPARTLFSLRPHQTCSLGRLSLCVSVLCCVCGVHSEGPTCARCPLTVRPRTCCTACHPTKVGCVAMDRVEVALSVSGIDTPALLQLTARLPAATVCVTRSVIELTKTATQFYVYQKEQV